MAAPHVTPVESDESPRAMELPNALDAALERSRADGQPVLLTKNGELVAVLLDLERFYELEAAGIDPESLEEGLTEAIRREDEAEARGEVSRPWEEVKREIRALLMPS